MPAAIDIGMEWKSVVTSEARFSLNGKRYLETQVITTEYRAMNEESVTVLAGTFDAIKVEITSTTAQDRARSGGEPDVREFDHAMVGAWCRHGAVGDRHGFRDAHRDRATQA